MQQKSTDHPGVARQKLERGQVGIAGEYAVLWKLIENGFAAARTENVSVFKFRRERAIINSNGG